jgi:hypothetical protein
MMGSLRFAIGGEADQHFILNVEILSASDPETVFGIVLGLLGHHRAPISKLFIYYNHVLND